MGTSSTPQYAPVLDRAMAGRFTVSRAPDPCSISRGNLAAQVQQIRECAFHPNRTKSAFLIAEFPIFTRSECQIFTRNLQHEIQWWWTAHNAAKSASAGTTLRQVSADGSNLVYAAPARTTTRSRRPTSAKSGYPRAYGEHTFFTTLLYQVIGLPPYSRGALTHSAVRQRSGRSTPALAGSTHH